MGTRKMGTRKGRFTIPNMISTVFLLFIFAVFFEPMTAAFTSISQASGISGTLTAVVLNSLPVVFLLAIISTPFILQEKRRIQRVESRRRTR